MHCVLDTCYRRHKYYTDFTCKIESDLAILFMHVHFNGIMQATWTKVGIRAHEHCSIVTH